MMILSRRLAADGWMEKGNENKQKYYCLSKRLNLTRAHVHIAAFIFDMHIISKKLRENC